MRSFLSSWRSSLVLVVGATCSIALAGCPSDETDPPGEADGSVDVGDDGTGTSVDVPVTPDTPDVVEGCTTDGDCADAFADLKACESAVCTAGECVRAAGVLDSPCDDGDPCTAVDSCQKDPSGAIVCIGTGNDCDDGDACNGVEGCGADGCTAGEPLACDNGDPCDGEEGCHPASGCAPGAPLVCADDGDVCNGAEVCDAGVGCISSGGPSCDDGSECTKDSCDATLGCQHETDTAAAGCCAVDADCDDGNACTQTSCEVATGTCQLTNLEGACDTGDPCAAGGTCQSGECVAPSGDGCTVLCTLTGSAGDTVDCPLGLARLGETQPGAAALTFTIGYYDDAAKLVTLVDSICIGETCAEATIPQTGTALTPSGHLVLLDPALEDWAGSVGVEIGHVSAPDKAINDGYYDSDALTGDGTLLTLRFKLTADTAGSPVVLHSVGATGPGLAALATKLVGETIVTTNAACGDDVCFDGKACTKDDCTDDTCSFVFQVGPCDDGNQCTTDDTCDEESGQCLAGGFAASGEQCTGADLCAEVGACDGEGGCELDPGKAVSCDDATDCVTWECSPATGTCVATPQVGASCNDGSKCTSEDVCDGTGNCGGTPITCKDDWGCTTDGCDPATGCTFTPKDGLCTDKDVCTDNTCSATGGCLTTNNTASCDDGVACTEGDKCANGTCAGVLDPTCGCTETADCASLEDGNLCNGTLACVEGQCQVEAGTVVSCPPDGFQCTQDWTCAPESGICAGAPLDCDDGSECTVDTCSPTKGCQHKTTPSCPIGYVCEISGSKGDKVDCAIRLTRGAQKDPIPSGGDFKLLWDKAKVSLDNLTDEFCVGPTCFPFDIATCDPDGTGCSYQALAPSGHSVVVIPKEKIDWDDKVSILVYHAGEAGKAITPAYTAAGAVVGEPLFVTARFELLADIPAGSPLQIQASDASFNPASGLDMSVTIQELGGVRTFVATPQ